MNKKLLKRGGIYSQKDLQNIFGVSGMSGIMFSKKNNLVVLISKNKGGLYENKWLDNIIHYTGEGQTGDQVISRGNKKIVDSSKEDIPLHLFEVYKKGEYFYQGEVYLESDYYQTTKPGKDEKTRNVYVFPLKLKDSTRINPINKSGDSKKVKKEAKILEDEELDYQTMTEEEVNEITSAAEDIKAILEIDDDYDGVSSYKQKEPRFIPVKKDYIKINKNKSGLGEAAELYVLNYEKQRLKEKALMKKPVHISKIHGDGAGYDILSYNGAEEEIYIEVKGTLGNKKTPFIITYNELEFAKKCIKENKNFKIYRVYDMDTKKPRCYIVDAKELNNHFDFIPTQYNVFAKKDISEEL